VAASLSLSCPNSLREILALFMQQAITASSVPMLVKLSWWFGLHDDLYVGQG
jgi:hypothetical protein